MKDSRFLYPFVMGTVACICLLIAGCDLFDTGTEEIPGQSGEATFYALGNLPSLENRRSVALGVSPDGYAVVGYSSSFDQGDPSTSDPYQAFIWTADDKEMQGLGVLRPDDWPSGQSSSSWAYAVSNRGSTVVGKSYSRGQWWDAAVWKGPPYSMNLIDSDRRPNRSYAYGVSANGLVVVGTREYVVGTLVREQAFRWSLEDGFTILGDGEVAYDISNDGSVIVGRTEEGQAFRWKDGAMTELSLLPGDGHSSANAVSADGSVIVGDGSISDTYPDGEAFRWEDGVMKGIGVIPGFDVSFALDVSADGTIIVGYNHKVDGERGLRSASIWTDATGMQQLQTVLELDYDLDLTGWSLLAANGISDDGKVIVGEGCNANRHINGDTDGCPFENAVKEAWVVYLDKPLTEIVSPSQNHTPDVAIASPADGGSFPTGTEIDFSGSAEDDEDGALAGDALVWTSSLDGEIGTSESFSRSDLSAGTHTITLTATDSEGGIGRTAVTIDVEGGSTTAGCEAFDLRLDYTPIEVAAGGSDAVAVFVDRSAGFTGQVELTFYSVNGGPSWSDVMTTWAFQPQFVPGDAAASTFSFTMKEDVSAGDYEFGIAGGSPLLEEADPPCTMPVTFRVVQ